MFQLFMVCLRFDSFTGQKMRSSLYFLTSGTTSQRVLRVEELLYWVHDTLQNVPKRAIKIIVNTFRGPGDPTFYGSNQSRSRIARSWLRLYRSGQQLAMVKKIIDEFLRTV